ncbi:MAG: hypothetical protein JW725_00915, partial [Candidatus Babeliaceae bacterium]|nr:hypothetical protein [Candidatus Babeliaceae bacterium]
SFASKTAGALIRHVFVQLSAFSFQSSGKKTTYDPSISLRTGILHTKYEKFLIFLKKAINN